MNKELPVVLTIAGSDSGGGAGIQADLKTFSSLKTFGTTAITSITAQNLSGVRSIQAIDPPIVKDQIEAVCEGFEVTAVKTGMLFSSEIIETVADSIRKFELTNLVVDPVFAATSGSKLIQDEAIETLKEKLFPLARVITPNMPEAEYLSGVKIEDIDSMRDALKKLVEKYNGPVFVLKGGHLETTAIDLYAGGGLEQGELKSDMVENVNNHGSGCTFASAVAAYLAAGNSVKESLALAKNYTSGSLRHALELKKGVRLIDHFWASPKGIH